MSRPPRHGPVCWRCAGVRERGTWDDVAARFFCLLGLHGDPNPAGGSRGYSADSRQPGERRR